MPAHIAGYAVLRNLGFAATGWLTCSAFVTAQGIRSQDFCCASEFPDIVFSVGEIHFRGKTFFLEIVCALVLGVLRAGRGIGGAMERQID